MLPQHNNRKRVLEPDTPQCVEEGASSDSLMKFNHKRQLQGTRGCGRKSKAIEDMSMGSLKGSASGGKHVDKELSTSQAFQNSQPRRQVSKVELVSF